MTTHQPADTDTDLPVRTHTDDGNALHLVDQCHQRIRYCPQRGRWLTWDDHRWAWDDAGRVTEAARHLIRTLTDDDGPEALRKHRHRSLDQRRLNAMVNLARTDPRIVVQAHQLDADPHALATPAGVVNLRDGTLTEPDPAANHTRSTTTAPDPDQPTPRWDQFLAQTFAGHPELTGYVQRLAGYSITGAITHHVLPFLHGGGDNGKSVFLDVVRHILGDYASTAPAGFLMSNKDKHETEIARLHGLRFVIASEVNQTDRFDEAKVKLLTGGDALTARFMGRDHFTFRPTHHLWLMGNHRPTVQAGGKSFWRRLRIVSFTNTIDPAHRDDELAHKLIRDEAPGILAWLIAGAVASQPANGGLADPVSVLTETRNYALEEDTLARFVEDRCHLGGGTHVRTNTKHVLDAYRDWCRDEGTRPVNQTVFGRELATRFDIAQVRSNGQRFYQGLTLLAADEGDDMWHQREPDEPDDRERYP